MGFPLRLSRRHEFSCLEKFINSTGCLPLDWESISIWSLPAAVAMQTGSCGVFLSSGSSSESGRGGRVDGEKRELEEEEAVGQDLFEFSYLFSGCPQERQVYLERQGVWPGFPGFCPTWAIICMFSNFDWGQWEIVHSFLEKLIF